ncbi:unnamed protein product [Thelazia callipaeda]|uniref:Alpha-1,3-glucosyltransferase n=1 Tax=Thelazia callipaeda TaxID=103827 RepID=A0A0N5CVB6_THECL|nr:unnamed protein product [Thelazia callipaeda]
MGTDKSMLNYSPGRSAFPPYAMQCFRFCCAIVFTLKVLFIPCYYSTDFEVHRNWMAITHTLPLRLWYYENTSEWTLDYPPLFAFFEYSLSQVASKIILSPPLVVQKDAYFSSELLLFQRLSVIAMDIIYVLSCFFLMRSLCEERSGDKCLKKNSVAAGIFLVTNVSLILIDNIHFQYNGFLAAFLLLSSTWVMRKSFILVSPLIDFFHRYEGALMYCILLNMKHIYLYYAPAYVFYYMVNYLLPFNKSFIIRCAKLTAVLILPFALALGPFIYFCGPIVLQQIWKRLFPFERGLTHAYWAPNLWALYNFADWYFYQVLRLAKRLPPKVHPPNYTSGIVQQFAHSILPCVTPFVTFLVTGILLVPVVFFTRRRCLRNFPLLLTLSAFAFFLGGYHVHEKAIVLITIPYTLLASLDHRFLPSFIVLSVIANVSLFPLFFTSMESIIKVSVTLCYMFLSVAIMLFLCPKRKLSALQRAFLVGVSVIQFYCLVTHQWIFGDDLKFMPLMLTSLSTALGILWIYLELLWVIFFDGVQSAEGTCSCKKLKS